jgi:hypothetical protein
MSIPRNVAAHTITGSLAILLLVAFLQVVRTLKDPGANIDFIYNADSLFPAAMYNDFFIDGFGVSGWQFPTAPFWFPDCLLYFICRVVLGTHGLAIIGFGFLQFVLLIFAFIFLVRAIHPKSSAFLTQTILVSAIFHLAIISHGKLDSPIFAYAIQIQSHTGVALLVVFGLGCIVRLVDPKTSLRNQITFGLIFTAFSSLVLTSDRLALIQFVIPLGCILVWGWVWHRRVMGAYFSTTRVGRVLVLLFLSVFFGLMLHHAVTMKDSLDNYVSNDSARRLTWNFITLHLREDLLQGRLIFWLFILSISIAFRWLWLTRRTSISINHTTASETTDPKRILLLFGIMSAGSNLAAFLATGALYVFPDADPDWNLVAKYFLPIYWVPFYTWGIWFARSRVQPILSRMLLIVCIIIVGIVISESRKTERDLAEFYPPIVKEMDQLAEKYDLHCGVAGYWESRLITLFSKRGLRVYPVNRTFHLSDVVPFHWLTNIYWYMGDPSSKHPNPQYDFVILKGKFFESNRQDWEQRFGTPAASEQCHGLPILIYNRESDLPFRNIFRKNLTAIINTEMQGKATTFDFPAACLPSQLEGTQDSTEKSLDRVAREGIHPAGFLSFGPFLPATAPRYRITLETTSQLIDVSNGSIHAILSKPGSNTSITRVVGGQNLLPGEKVFTTFDVEIPPECKHWILECQVQFLGKGQLTEHSLLLQRVK